MPHLINANEVSRSAIYRTAKSAGMSMTTSGIMHRTVEANGIHLHIATLRRLPPGLQRPATRTRTKPELTQRLLGVARRYAETEIVRATGAFLAVVAVVVLAGLAWLWVFRPSHGERTAMPIESEIKVFEDRLVAG